MEEKKEVNMWNAKNVQEFLEAMGSNVDLNSLREAKKKLTVHTLYGDVDMETYDGLIATKIYSYLQYGIAQRIGKMVKDQSKGTADTNDIKVILLEMATLDLNYGLRPITHVIPLANSTYIKADGYLFYGKSSGKLRNIKYEEEEKGGVWTTKCIIETTEGSYDGITTVRATSALGDDPRERARTKSMRRALRKAFPIGAGDETVDEVNTVEVLSEPVSDLNQIAESKATNELPEGSKALYEAFKALPREEQEKKRKELLLKYKVLSLEMLNEEQAKEALNSLKEAVK